MVSKRAASEQRRSYGKMMDGREWTRKQAKSSSKRERPKRKSKDDWPSRKDTA